MSTLDMKALRSSMGITQGQLAEKLGMSLRAIQDIESGATEMREVHRLALAALLRPPAADGPLTLRQEAWPLAMDNLPTGQVFVGMEPGIGHVVGIMAEDPHHKLIGVLGGMVNDHARLPGLVAVGAFSFTQVFAIPQARFEIARDAMGLTAPINHSANGFLGVDALGEGYFVFAGGARDYLSLNTGMIVERPGKLAFFDRWRLVWRPEGAERNVDLLKSS